MSLPPLEQVVVVEALRLLALQYPRKQAVLMGQLADMLRSEGGLAYKEAIAATIITIIEENPDAKEKGAHFSLNITNKKTFMHGTCCRLRFLC